MASNRNYICTALITYDVSKGLAMKKLHSVNTPYPTLYLTRGYKCNNVQDEYLQEPYTKKFFYLYYYFI